MNTATANSEHLPAIHEDHQAEAAREIAAELEARFPKSQKPLSLSSAIARRTQRAAVAAAFLLMIAPAAGAYEWNASQVRALADQIIQAESSGAAGAVGDGGKSRGLMQIQKGTWERHTALPWSQAFDPATNRAVGEAEIRRIIAVYRARGTDPAPAYVAWTYNTGSFIKNSLPRTNGKGQVHPWTLGHPNRVYRSIYQQHFMNKGNTANVSRSS